MSGLRVANTENKRNMISEKVSAENVSMICRLPKQHVDLIFLSRRFLFDFLMLFFKF
jgi:hypothetical protein